MGPISASISKHILPSHSPSRKRERERERERMLVRVMYTGGFFALSPITREFAPTMESISLFRIIFLASFFSFVFLSLSLTLSLFAFMSLCLSLRLSLSLSLSVSVPLCLSLFSPSYTQYFFSLSLVPALISFLFHSLFATLSPTFPPSLFFLSLPLLPAAMCTW